MGASEGRSIDVREFRRRPADRVGAPAIASDTACHAPPPLPFAIVNPTLRRSIRYGILALPSPVRSRVEIVALRAWETFQVRAAQEDTTELAQGLPVPPAKLRVLVHSADRDRFLESGRRQASFFRSMFERNGGALEKSDAILDFGCGCGRLARHWADLNGPAVFGCDVNPKLVAWCRQNLPFVNATTSSPEPPLPYPDNSFDFVYALSIFTHLPEREIAAWMAELRRIIRPGGQLLFTVHGEGYRDRLSDDEAERYSRGEAVVQFDTAAGTNLCTVYQPPKHVRGNLDGFELVEQFLTSEHPDEAAETWLKQDSYLVAVKAAK